MKLLKSWWFRGIAMVLVASMVAGLLLVLSPSVRIETTTGVVSISLGTPALAQPVGEVLEKRTQTSKTYYLGNSRYSMDTKIGSVHYKNNPSDTVEPWKEINNQFIPAVSPWNWQMTQDGYKTYVLNNFTAGQVLKFESQGSTVAFQPMELQWTNNLDQIQSISMPQNVIPTLTNTPVELLPGMSGAAGTIRWNNAYGTGRHFEWTNTPGRLNKTLQLDAIPSTPPQYILDGGNPVLALHFIFDPGNLDIYVDGQLWDKSSEKQTANLIVFKDWYFLPVRYWDSSSELEPNEGIGVTELRNVGSKLYVSALVPYSWLQTATYPVFIDPAVQTHDTPKTLYFENTALSTKVWRTSESAPSAADEVTSIKSGTGAVGRYYPFVPGITDSVAYDTVFIEGDADGAHGWRSENPYTGSFLIDNWTISFKLKNRAKYAHAGTVNARIYKTSVADPAVGELTKLNAVDGVSAIVTFSATADEVKTGTVSVWCNQNLLFDNEYILLVLNWKVTTVGTNVQAGAKIVVNEGAAEQVVTADYTEGSPLEVQVGASADDAYEHESDGVMYTTDTYVNNRSATLASLRYWGGYRFVSASFPIQGTTIDVAYMKVYPYSITDYDDANFNIHFEELAAPAAFTTDAYDITGRDRTEASVSWIGDAIFAGGWDWYNSPSLCGVGSPIQEVFDAFSPTAMVIITRPNQDATKVFAVRSWDNTTNPANTWGAILHLEWEEAGEPAITVSPAVYNFGTIAEGSTTNSTTNWFTIDNTSTMQTDQTISVTTANWTSAGNPWVHSDTCTPGVDTAGLKSNRNGVWGVGDVIVKYAAPNYIYENCPANTDYSFGLGLWAPTTFSDGVLKQIVVRISAVAG